MPRPPIDLHLKVRELLGHAEALPTESSCPIQHYKSYTNDCFNMIRYMDRHLDATGIYEAVLERHLAMMRRMVLANVIQSFERFLKELAILCVDNLAHYTFDDRFDCFTLRGSGLVANFAAGTIGKAMCEGDTWLKNKTINERFRDILQSHFGAPWNEFLFPEENQQPVGEQARAKTVAILWQIRHNLAHNVGAITNAEALKFRLLTKSPVEAERLLSPTEDDLHYVKRFLFETAEAVNQKIGARLARVLTEIHQSDPTLFDAQQKANSLSRNLDYVVTIRGATGVL